MACKRSGVRIPIAPPRSKRQIRNPEPTVLGLVQQQKTATQQHDVPLRQPGSGSGTGRSCWHDLLKPHAKTDSERPDQEERSFPPSFDTCTGAGAWRVLAGDSCRLRNSSGHSCPTAPAGAVGEHRRGRAEPVAQQGRAGLALGAASLLSRRECGAPRRNWAHLGAAPPQRPAWTGRAAAHRSGPGRCPGERDCWRPARRPDPDASQMGRPGLGAVLLSAAIGLPGPAAGTGQTSLAT
jgi:hypothetical protein